MRFAKLATMHEHLRLGDKLTGNQLRGWLTDKDEALYFYEFFFPTKARVERHNAVSKIAKEMELYFDVVDNMLPHEEVWYALASESNKAASKDMTCQKVLDLPFEDMSFSQIAQQFNEIEARLVWRYLLSGKPPISKRSFFGKMAASFEIPPKIVRQNTNQETLAKMYDDPESIHVLKEWWRHPRLFPAPARWRRWSKLSPPQGEYYAVVIPNGDLHYHYAGKVRHRNGELVTDEYRKCRAGTGVIIEAVGDVGIDIYEGVYRSFDERRHTFSVETEVIPLEKEGAWFQVNVRLNSPDVQAVRLIEGSSIYEPDEVMGYVMYPHRSRVNLCLHEIDDSHWTLAALDGLDELVTVAKIPIPEKPHREDGGVFGRKGELNVIEVAAVQVGEDGYINQGIYIGYRPNLGIGDIVQVTELIERGMSNDTE